MALHVGAVCAQHRHLQPPSHDRLSWAGLDALLLVPSLVILRSIASRPGGVWGRGPSLRHWSVRRVVACRDGGGTESITIFGEREQKDASSGRQEKAQPSDAVLVGDIDSEEQQQIAASRLGLRNANFAGKKKIKRSPFGLLPYSLAAEELLETPQVEVAVFGFVLLSSLVVALETLPILTEPDWQGVARLLCYTEDAICAFFFVEFWLRWYSRSLRPSYIIKPLVVIDVLSWLPLFLRLAGITGSESVAGSVAAGIQSLRLLRVFRLQRFLRDFQSFLMLAAGLGIDKSFVTPVQMEVVRVLLTLFSLLYTATGAIYAAEHNSNPQFPDFFTALYFGLTTLTTVGFGDITPITVPGRFVVMGSILAGVAVVPIQLSRLAEVFMATGRSQPSEDPAVSMTSCSTCGASPHRSEAAFCWRCGSVLKINGERK